MTGDTPDGTPPTTPPDTQGSPQQGHLVLVGLPGAGKTTVGREVASRLSLRFIDLDSEIERREGRTIAEIFAADGEESFRKTEHILTADLAAEPPLVLAPGGGWITNPKNVQLVRPPGRLVYLKVSPEVALRRLGDDVASRPLLNRPDPLGELRQLYRQRENAYLSADLHLDTEVIDLQELAGLIGDFCLTLGLPSGSEP